jgi:uncharacterized protein YebE (UPF0316 family)
MPSLSATNIITKKSGEKILVEMKFDEWLDEAVSISAINSVTSEVCSGGTSDLTITGQIVDGYSVTFFVDDGTDGVRYKVSVNITTSAGETLIGDGQLVVED